MKMCTGCKNYKDNTDYAINRQGKNGLRSKCKRCVHEKHKEYMKTESYKSVNKKASMQPSRKQKQPAYSAKYYSTEQGEISRQNAYLKKYGLNHLQYKKLVEDQNKTCPICLLHQDDIAISLCVDHCHKTKKIRGILCKKCNLGLGQFNDNIDMLKRAVLYLEKSSEETKYGTTS